LGMDEGESGFTEEVAKGLSVAEGLTEAAFSARISVSGGSQLNKIRHFLHNRACVCGFITVKYFERTWREINRQSSTRVCVGVLFAMGESQTRPSVSRGKCGIRDTLSVYTV
jgi:hypothetical protein